eukprot:747779_1
MSIYKQLAEAFNGGITVSSVPEKGASFTAHFCLPRLSVEDQAVVRGEERERRHRKESSTSAPLKPLHPEKFLRLFALILSERKRRSLSIMIYIVGYMRWS